MDVISAVNSNKIFNMAFVCACLVVSIHVTGISGEVGSLTWILHAVIACNIAHVAVPFFFVISGYFVTTKIYCVGTRAVVFKRVRTLIVPYVVWNILYAVFVYIVGIVSDYFAGRQYRLFDFPRFILQVSGLDWPILYQLWYIRVMLVFVVLTPFILFLLKRMRYGFLILMFVLYLFARAYASIYVGFWLWTPFWYILGAFLAHESRSGRVDFKRAIMLIIPLLVIGAIASFVFNENRLVLPFMIPVMMLILWLCIPGNVVWNGGRMNFQIYILHPFMILVLQYCWHLTTWMPTWLLFVFRWCGAILMSLLFANIFKRFLPRGYAFAFGGR